MDASSTSDAAPGTSPRAAASALATSPSQRRRLSVTFADAPSIAGVAAPPLPSAAAQPASPPPLSPRPRHRNSSAGRIISGATSALSGEPAPLYAEPKTYAASPLPHTPRSRRRSSIASASSSIVEAASPPVSPRAGAGMARTKSDASGKSARSSGSKPRAPPPALPERPTALLHADPAEDSEDASSMSRSFLEEYGLAVEDKGAAKEKSTLLRNVFGRKSVPRTQSSRSGADDSPLAVSSPPTSPSAAEDASGSSLQAMATEDTAAPAAEGLVLPEQSSPSQTVQRTPPPRVPVRPPQSSSRASAGESTPSSAVGSASPQTSPPTTRRDSTSEAASLHSRDGASTPGSKEQSRESSLVHAASPSGSPRVSRAFITPVALYEAESEEEDPEAQSISHQPRSGAHTPATTHSDYTHDSHADSLEGSSVDAFAEAHAGLQLDGAAPVRAEGDAQGIVSDDASVFDMDRASLYTIDDEATRTFAPLFSAAGPALPARGTDVHASAVPPTLPMRPETVPAMTAQEQKAAAKEAEKLRKAEEKQAAAAEKVRVAEEKEATKVRQREEKQAEKDRKEQEKLDARIAQANERRSESRKRREARERKVALADREDLEVQRFLNDFGKAVHEVRSGGPLEPESHEVVLPSLRDFRDSSSGQANYVGYAFAFAFALVSYLSPARFVDVQAGGAGNEVDMEALGNSSDFRLASLKANGARLYLAVPMYEGLYASLRHLWRWDSKLRTGVWCLGYTICWWRGLLLPAMHALLVLYLLRRRFFPPKAEALSRMLAEQQRRSAELAQARNANSADVVREAEQKSKLNAAAKVKDGAEASAKESKYGLAADAMRRYGRALTVVSGSVADLHERMRNCADWRSPPATMRVVALIVISGLFTLCATPWMLARLPGLTIGALLFVLAPIVEHRPQWLAMEWNLDVVDLFLAGVPNDAQIAMSILRRRAAEGKPLLGDRDMQIALAGGSDDEDDAPLIDVPMDALMDEQSEAGSTVGSTVGSSAVGSSTSVATSAATTAELKNRKVDWAKWKNRATYGRDLLVTGSEVLAGQRALQLPRFDTGASSAPGAGKMAAIGSGLARGANWGLEQVSQQTSRALVERQLVALGDTLPTDSVHWSIYNGICGHLIVRASPTPRLLFVSLFAQKAGAAADAQPVIDETGQGVPAEIATAKIRVLLDVHLESLLVLKKTATVNLRFSKMTLDGLDVSVRAKTHSFSSVANRDLAFNHILALAPLHWHRA